MEATLRPTGSMLDWACDQWGALKRHSPRVSIIPAVFWHHKAGQCTTHIHVVTRFDGDSVTVQLLRPHINPTHLGVIFQPPHYKWPGKYAIHPDCSAVATYMTGISLQDVPAPDGTDFRPRIWYVGRARGYSMAYRNRADLCELEPEDDVIDITQVEDTLVV